MTRSATPTDAHPQAKTVRGTSRFAEKPPFCAIALQCAHETSGRKTKKHHQQGMRQEERTCSGMSGTLEAAVPAEKIGRAVQSQSCTTMQQIIHQALTQQPSLFTNGYDIGSTVNAANCPAPATGWWPWTAPARHNLARCHHGLAIKALQKV